jgi:hypothetical protein
VQDIRSSLKKVHALMRRTRLASVARTWNKENEMEMLEPNMQSLFAQLGEANDDASIARFIAKHGYLPGGTHLHEAPFWSPSQAAFLREAKQQDAEWAPVVDALNTKLHLAWTAPSHD